MAKTTTKKRDSVDFRLYKISEEIGAISKDSSNPFYDSKYFDINKIVKELTPYLTKYKLKLYQPLRADFETKINYISTFLNV